METKTYYCDICQVEIRENREPGTKFMIEKETLLEKGGVARVNSILTIYASVLRPGGGSGPMLSRGASHICLGCAKEIHENGDLTRIS